MEVSARYIRAFREAWDKIKQLPLADQDIVLTVPASFDEEARELTVMAAEQDVTFLATIKSPTVAATGPVTFTAGKTVLGTAQLADGKATFTISTLPVGTTTVTANYYGDSNISGSSASITETVKP